MEQNQRSGLMERYCQSRDVSLRNDLVTEYLYLAENVAKKYAGRGVEYEDLKQIASVALIGAIERFDCTKGIRFEAYAVPTLSGVVKNYFRDMSRVIRLPRGIGENLQRVRLAEESLYQSLGRVPTVQELVQSTGLSQEAVLETMEAAQSVSLSSLDQEVGEDETPLIDLLRGEDGRFEQSENRDLIDRVLAKCSDTEKAIVSMRFFEGMSQRETARQMGVSQMYVSRMERKLLNKFREAFME